MVWQDRGPSIIMGEGGERRQRRVDMPRQPDATGIMRISKSLGPTNDVTERDAS